MLETRVVTRNYRNSWSNAESAKISNFDFFTIVLTYKHLWKPIVNIGWWVENYFTLKTSFTKLPMRPAGRNIYNFVMKFHKLTVDISKSDFYLLISNTYQVKLKNLYKYYHLIIQQQ